VDGTQGFSLGFLYQCYAAVMMLKFPVSETDAGTPRPRRHRDKISACTIPISDCVRSIRNFPTHEDRFLRNEEFSAALLACIDQALFENDTSAIVALTDLDHDERFRRIPDALRGEPEACNEVALALDALACGTHAQAIRAFSGHPVESIWITPGDSTEKILERLRTRTSQAHRKQR
jgi:hypothetical protein